jgi:hypothetical protein
MRAEEEAIEFLEGDIACHPEAGAARRGTSQAPNRFREKTRRIPSSNAGSLALADIATARSLGALRQPRDDNCCLRFLYFFDCSFSSVAEAEEKLPLPSSM